MNIELWSFDKKRNSTKRPPGGGVTLVGELKQSFTVTELSIDFNLGALSYSPTYNYCYIPNLRRYYFIVNWCYNKGLWTAVCCVDVLATYKTEIGNSRQYVTRAYSNYNPNIIDSAYLSKAENIVRNNGSITSDTFWGASAWGNNGTVVIGTIGANSGAVGAVSYYAMSVSSFASLINTMLGGISWMGISATEISEELQKALINPTQYIVSCRWYPILYSGFTQGTAVTAVKLGWWSFAASARLLSTISSAWVNRNNELTIPHHYQAISNPRLAYLDLAPFSTYMLKFLPFGVFEIDSTELYDKTYLGVNVDVNLMTGDAVLKVSAKSGTGSYNWNNAFLVVEGQIGVTIPVGQVSADIGKYKSALYSGVASGIAQLIDKNNTEAVMANETAHHSGKF